MNFLSEILLFGLINAVKYKKIHGIFVTIGNMVSSVPPHPNTNFCATPSRNSPTCKESIKRRSRDEKIHWETEGHKHGIISLNIFIILMFTFQS